MPSVATELKQSLERINSLPALSVLAQKILALPLDTDKGEAQLLKLIAQDPQISAKIIGLSNSALFGAPGIISSTREATMRLGLTVVKSVSIGMAAASTLRKQSEGKLKSVDLWMRSMAIAIGMRVIARKMPPKIRPAEDQVFLSGLLHDIGYNVLSFLDTPLSDTLHEQIKSNPERPLAEIEEEVLATHHGELGAQLGLYWGLPKEIVNVIRHHHSPEHVEDDMERTLVTLIYITEKILANTGIVEHTAGEVTEDDWNALGIDSGEIPHIFEEISTATEQAHKLANSI